MGNLMNSIFGDVSDKSADETIAFNAMASTAGFSQAYLAATLEATTPEVRRLFSEYTTQNVMAHEAVTALCMEKGWVNPYQSPNEQLQTTLEQSQSVVSNPQQ